MKIKEINYKDVRDDIKNGDILMYKGRKLFSKIIRLFTHSEYSHAGIAVWWNQRLMVLEAVGKGVVVTPLSRNICHYKGDVELFTYDGEISDDKRRVMVITAQKELGKSYAKWKLIWFGIKLFLKLKMDVPDKSSPISRFFCSQYVSMIYESNGIDLVIKKANKYTSPDDIVKSEKTVKKGIFKKSKKDKKYCEQKKKPIFSPA
ncbi:MAG: hypothetical protein GTO45_39770 [Candidatus Aminicenantes bacterium]|nr:hypothetical protein [Candidatus Aminicenantes bacterium]NIM83377.1 hypothetical protein [Candidatus Aminicenantes bacterium]NIN24259.1 hypothetical protein [Candidatus Aminicenantes bacterium]NIN46503.1 hypothetical protein [Candidatus Aminicenantes bacterium]NIN90922.1 hypothetical protein [Candidatus Aminicenantes bacterium]